MAEGLQKWIDRQHEIRISEDMQARIDANMKKTRAEYWRRSRTPRQKYTFRMEVIKVVMVVAIPVISVWAFNHPRFQEKAQRIMNSMDNETPRHKAESAWATEKFLKFTEEVKAMKRQEERAIFLREQMAFEEAKKLRKKHNI